MALTAGGAGSSTPTHPANTLGRRFSPRAWLLPGSVTISPSKTPVGDVRRHLGPSSQMAALSLPTALVCGPHQMCSLPAPTQRLEVIRHVCFQPSPPLRGRGCLRAREGPAVQHPGARALLTDCVVLCILPSPPGHTSRLKPLVLEVLKRSIKMCDSDILSNEPNH